MTVAELISTRLERMAMKPPQLRNELSRKGVKVTRQTVHAWTTGEQQPTLPHMLALWEVLVVPVEERQDWMNAVATRAAEREAIRAAERAENRPPDQDAA